MGLLENQSVMSETSNNNLRSRNPSPSNESTHSTMDRYSLLNAELLLQQIQSRRKAKEEAFLLATTEIKTVTKAVIQDLKMQEEELLDQLWKAHRKELSDLQKTHQDIKRKITDMITIRNSIKRQRRISLEKEILVAESKVNSILQSQVENQIELLTGEGSSVLQRTETVLVFVNEMPDFRLGKLLANPLKNLDELQQVQSPRQRRNTVLSLPDIDKHAEKPSLRKAHSTDGIFKTATKTMTLAFEMSNEDLLPSKQEDSEETDASFAINTIGADIGQIRGPRDITHLPNGDIVITESDNGRLQKFSPTGQALQLMKSVELKPCGVTMTKDGYIAVADKQDNTIKIFTQCGDKICQFGTGYFHDLSFLDTDSNDNYIVIDNNGTWQQSVFVYNAMTGVKRRIGYRDDTYVVNHPEYVFIDKADNIIISDSGNHCIWVFTSAGKYQVHFGQQGHKLGDLCYPKGICMDNSGNYLVADCANHRICQFDCRGQFMKVIAGKIQGVYYPQVVTLNNSYLTVLQHSTILFLDSSKLEL